MSFGIVLIGIGSLAAVLAISFAWDFEAFWSAMRWARRRRHTTTRRASSHDH